MDPNATLTEIDAAHDALHAAVRNGERAAMMDALTTLAEHASALDLWIVRGGFLPTAPKPRPFETTHVWLRESGQA